MPLAWTRHKAQTAMSAIWSAFITGCPVLCVSPLFKAGRGRRGAVYAVSPQAAATAYGRGTQGSRSEGAANLL